jgi:hypothetical protein
MEKIMMGSRTSVFTVVLPSGTAAFAPSSGRVGKGNSGGREIGAALGGDSGSTPVETGDNDRRLPCFGELMIETLLVGVVGAAEISKEGIAAELSVIVDEVRWWAVF